MEVTGKIIRLNRLCAGDFHLYSLLATNADVMKYITGKGLTLAEAEDRFLKALALTESNPGAGFFTVRNIPNGDFIGIAKLVQLDDRQHEVGYMLLPEFWSQGFATGLVKCLLDIARDNRYKGELTGIVDPANPASIRVLTKFGFQLFETGLMDGLEAAYYKLKLEE
jgi:ribosomal-protein-alanine N-acetyltransferase